MRTALELAGAPEALVAWLDEAGDTRTAWDGCDRGDWIVWLAACAGVSLHSLLGAACACAERALPETSPARLQPLANALSAARSGASVEDCARAAAACETATEAAPESYRTAVSPGYRAAARSASWLARAAESLAAATAREEADREIEALHRAVGVGVPPALMTPPAPGPPSLVPSAVADDPTQQALAFAVAAIAQAVIEAGRAVARDQHGAPLEAAVDELSDVLHERLAPLFEVAAGRPD